MFDLILKNGLICDGSGGSCYPADLAVLDGRIARIAPHILEVGAQVIELQGELVTPGFIDIHRHADACVLRKGFGEAELRQGITTMVNGNCGLSLAPCPPPHDGEILDYLAPILGSWEEGGFSTFARYMDRLDQIPLLLHTGMLVGSATLRAATQGFGRAPLDGAALERLHGLLGDALDSGALGVSLGLAYAPDLYYDVDELARALAPIQGMGIPIVAHMRGEGDMLPQAVDEVIALARRLNAPLHISHYKCVGKRNWGRLLEKATERLLRAQEEGLAITCDVYPWTAGSSQLTQVLPPSFLEGGMGCVVKRLQDAKSRAECRTALKKPSSDFENLVELLGWENIIVSGVQSGENRPLVGRSIAEIAVLQQKDPFDVACDLLVRERGNVTMINHIACERDVETILRYPFSCIISDAIYSPSGKPHPRRFGTFPRVFQEYVEKRGVLTLEQAVHKMTHAPAQVLGIVGKGLLREGYDADLAVFHPKKLCANASYTTPNRLATGMRAVIVGGKVALEYDTLTGETAGRPVRRA